MIEAEWDFGENIQAITDIRKAVKDTPDILDAKALHLILYNNKNPVACGSLFFDKGCYYLAHLCVLPEHQQQHIGDMLIKLLLLKGFRMMAEKILCITPAEYSGFLKKYGFCSLEEISGKITMEVTPATLIIQSKCGQDCSKCLNKDSCQ